MFQSIRRTLIKCDRQLDKLLPLILILSLAVILRVPNFFEPYWYGDEAIYLTVGSGLNQGKVLYRDIMDHKTPIIYYLARVPNQFDFRLLLTGWMLVATGAFYFLTQKLIKRKQLVWLATLVMMLLTTLPWFEGNIPNGELFVVGFVLVGFLLLSRTSLFHYAFQKKRQQTKVSKSQLSVSFLNRLRTSFQQTSKEHWLLVTAGFFFGLGLMTKVPALFDFVAALSLIWIGLVQTVKLKELKKLYLQKGLPTLPQAITYLILLSFGFILPLLLSVIYFYFKGALPDYLEYGLLYNLHYAGTWHQHFPLALLGFLFTLKGKTLFLIFMLGLITGFRKKLSTRFQFIAFWFSFDLVASLLSNRPYPHYFIQLVAPLSLLVAILIDESMNQLKKNINRFITSATVLIGVGLVFAAIGAILLLKVSPYPTFAYYRRFTRLVTGRITPIAYRNSFNYLDQDNYRLAPIIRQTDEREIFIWGTNPMLYALTETTPPTRFIVLFHIEDLDAYAEVYQDLSRRLPRYIVVMKEAHAMPTNFANLINRYYLPNYQFDHFVLWRKISAK